MSPITEKQRGKIKTRRIGWGLIIYIGFGFIVLLKWDKVFKNGPSNICERQPLKDLKGCNLPDHTISLRIF